MMDLGKRVEEVVAGLKKDSLQDQAALLEEADSQAMPLERGMTVLSVLQNIPREKISSSTAALINNLVKDLSRVLQSE